MLLSQLIEQLKQFKEDYPITLIDNNIQRNALSMLFVEGKKLILTNLSRAVPADSKATWAADHKGLLLLQLIDILEQYDQNYQLFIEPYFDQNKLFNKRQFILNEVVLENAYKDKDMIGEAYINGCVIVLKSKDYA